MDYLLAFNACKAAIIVTDSQYKVIHTNHYFNDKLSEYLTIHHGSDITKTFNLQIKLQPGSHQEIKHLNEHFSVSTESITVDEQINYVLTLSRTTAEQNLKHVLSTMDQKLATGYIDLNLNITEQEGLAKEVVDAINQGIAKLGQHLSNILDSVNLLSECDLRIGASDANLSGQLGTLQTRLMVTIANLSESIKQTKISSDAMSNTTGNMVSQNHNLEQQTIAQSEAVIKTSQNMEELSSSVAQAAQNANDASELSMQTSNLAQQGRAAVLEVVYN